MKDYISGEIMKVSRESRELVERNVTPLEKKSEVLIKEVHYVREAIGNKIGELQNSSDGFS